MKEITEEEVKRVLVERLKREINKELVEGRPMPQDYIEGYRTAVRDIFWDLFGKKLILEEDLRWQSKKQKEGKLVVTKIDLKKIK